MPTSNDYILKEYKHGGFTKRDYGYLAYVAIRTAALYKSKHRWGLFNVRDYCEHDNGRVVICMRGDRHVGVMCSRLTQSVWDENVTTLCQDLLFASPGTRAAKILMDDFVDFGKLNANHILACIGKKTNIKPRSLERLGFKELETWYRIEVERG